MDSDEKLVQDALAAPPGDTRAFSELVRRHQARVLANCRHLTRSDDAEDLAQEVFVKLYFKLGLFEGRARFGTWVQRIKVNHCLNYLKSRRGRAFVDLVDAETTDPGALRVDATAEGELDRDRDRERIRAVLDSLPDGLRVPLVMRDVDGLAYAEIQAALGLGESATKMRIARARQEFRSRWQGAAGQGAPPPQASRP